MFLELFIFYKTLQKTIFIEILHVHKRKKNPGWHQQICVWKEFYQMTKAVQQKINK